MSSTISIPDFAKLVGVSRQAIYKAIREGRISDGLTEDRKRLIKDVAMVEYRGNTDPSKQGRLKQEAHDKQSAYKPSASDTQPPAPTTADFNTAKKHDMVYRAKIRELEYKEKLGKLVDKDAVYRELFNAGKELRTALMAIPDRCIDDVLACMSRNEAHSFLYKAISEALEMLSDIENRKFGGA